MKQAVLKKIRELVPEHKNKILEEFMALADDGRFESWVHTKDYSQVDYDEIGAWFLDKFESYFQERMKAAMPERRAEDPELEGRDYLSKAWNACLFQLEENLKK